ncbi:DASH complex subunit Dad3-domain-containing protein [Coprinopsis sp. MPI-PUGE-AT-0042]|nr:DASH complex subunit Dad3-domain-containing protein [Coprinopsis sp. MPI-PUGE-AT-0042]
MTSEISAADIFTANPYEGHPSLSQLEAEVLWEYAKLAQHIRSVRLHSISWKTYYPLLKPRNDIAQLSQKTRSLNDEPDKTMLARLRVLEKKMGLVLTLFKASVWGVINEQPAPEGYYQDGDSTVQH